MTDYQTVLVEGRSRKDSTELMGRTSCNRTVNFKGPAGLVGDMVDVTITEARSHSLRGQVSVDSVDSLGDDSREVAAVCPDVNLGSGESA